MSHKVSKSVFGPRLTIELVPKTSWGDNLRSSLSISNWNKLRDECFKNANSSCETCEDKKKSRKIECHEIWEYDDKKKRQTLKGLIALCPSCHQVKHIGLAGLMGKIQVATKHLAKVNCWNLDKAESYINECFLKWDERSQFMWLVDTSWLETKGIAVKKKVEVEKHVESELEKAILLNNEKKVVKILSESNRNLSYVDIKGNTILHRAVESKNISIVKALIKHPEYSKLINVGNKTYVTPLLLACRNGNKSIVSQLIKQGADVGKRCRNNKTILHYALRSNDFETFEFMFKNYGKDLITIADSTGGLFFHRIMSSEGIIGFDLSGVRAERKKMLNLVLRKLKKEEIVKKDNYGKTFLHCAAYFGDREMILEVLKIGGKALLNSVDNYGKTPINEAALATNVEAVKTLLMEGARYRHVTDAGETAIGILELKLGKKQAREIFAPFK